MRIQNIHIENFGKIHDFDMELENGLNVIRAANGWGKTTLAAFLKAMLYGLDYTTKRSLKENERKKYTPWQGGSFGGSMEFSADRRSYRVERFFGAKDKEDSFCLYDLATGLESRDYSERLGEELFRLDRAAFERSCFFAQQDFAASLNDSLNARLTRVEEDAGDMQNYEKALASLEDRMKYYQKTGGRGQLAQWEQERRRVLEELAECRNKEAAIGEWKAKIAEKERQEEELRILTERTEAQLQKVQEYRAKAEQKERYEALRQQAGVQEEKLRQLGVELGRYEQAPLGEEALDRCRETIYRVNTLQQQEKDAEEQLAKAGRELEEVRKRREELPASGKKLLAVLTGCVAAAGFLTLMFLNQVIPGILILIAGVGMAVYLMQKSRRAEQEIMFRQKELEEKEAVFAQKEAEYRTLKEKGDDLEEKVRKVLYIPEGTPTEELEYYWKLERQKSQDYVMLKQNYGVQAKEARRSQELFREYASRFTEEELREFRNLQEPEQDAGKLQGFLRQYRSRQEALRREQNQLQHQVHMLAETAERIPELEEESERLAQEITDGMRAYGLLEKTAKYLKTARDQFSTRHLKELQAGLEHYLSELEPEQEAVPALDVKLKVKLRDAGVSRDLEYYSAGWQDMLQIAERFAVVDALYEKEQPVLVLDDPFVNLDTAKQSRAMALLKKMSEKWQMIYFTCHE